MDSERSETAEQTGLGESKEDQTPVDGSSKTSSPNKIKVSKKKRARKTKIPKYPDAGVGLKNWWDYETVLE